MFPLDDMAAGKYRKLYCADRICATFVKNHDIMYCALIILVCGFEAFINGKHIVGEVKEKEQAHKEYKQAISEGHGAYLMDEETPVITSYNYRSIVMIYSESPLFRMCLL